MGIAWVIVHIVIMGCGRTGAALAGEFESRGHTVAIIDRISDAFRRLPASFQGQKITGVGFDRETLVSAGVEEAFGFAAVSDGDNSNILAARVVRETYGVENVVARISDPGRAEVYRRLGIPTVAPVPWTSEQIVSRLLPEGSDEVYTDTAAGIVLRRLPFNDAWVGRKYSDIEAAAGVRAMYVGRFGEGLLVDTNTLIQAGDEPYFAFAAKRSSAVERTTARPPGGKK